MGQVPIGEVEINPKSKNALEQMLVSLQEIFRNEEYNEKVFLLLEELLDGKDKRNGRPGMDLWVLFVLAQVRQCMNYSYETLHHQANNDYILRRVMGVEQEWGFGRTEFEYQNIYDNVTLLDTEKLTRLNDIIVAFGHGEVFKKKEGEELQLKNDSFVVESNVHFPTDYNLLWDCIRKCLDIIKALLDRHPDIGGWRKIYWWRRELKSLARELGKASGSGGKNKEERVRTATAKYLDKAILLSFKIRELLHDFPLEEMVDAGLCMSLEYYAGLLDKHIGLLDRRVMKGEQIPHHEKMFSIFESYTEWIVKGKSRPSVELGKKVAITTDQWGLVVDMEIMKHEQDRDVIIRIADRLLSKYRVASLSVDKGYWDAENRELLKLYIKDVVMPKLGRLSEKDKELEESAMFKRLNRKHSAVESNINELEHRGLDRCPDKGEGHFDRYVAASVCAYNLKKIGAAILRARLEAEKKEIRKAS